MISKLTRRHALATRILQLDQSLTLLKGARRPSPDGILRAQLLKERTQLIIQLRSSFPPPTPTRITRLLLTRLAYLHPANTITLTSAPSPAHRKTQ